MQNDEPSYFVNDVDALFSQECGGGENYGGGGV